MCAFLTTHCVFTPALVTPIFTPLTSPIVLPPCWWLFAGAGLYPSKIGGEAGGHPAAPCTPAYFSSSMQSAYGPQGNFSKLKSCSGGILCDCHGCVFGENLMDEFTWTEEFCTFSQKTQRMKWGMNILVWFPENLNQLEIIPAVSGSNINLL